MSTTATTDDPPIDWSTATVNEVDGEQLGAMLFVSDLPIDCSEVEYRVVGETVELKFL